MKTAVKAVGWGLAIVGVVLASGFGYVQATWDRDFNATPLPAIHASADPAVIARGEYLVRSVAHCSGCHARTAHSAFDVAAPLAGGFEIHAGPFGTYYAANLTADPVTGLGKVSDGQIARVIRSGITRTGRAAPVMMTSVGPMADEDLTAVVSFLRAQAPAANPVPADQWGLVAKALSGILKPRTDEAPPFVAEGVATAERGRYLALGPAACGTCHTPTDNLFRPNGPALSGNTMPQPDETVADREFVIPNLTPDSATGHITGWSEDQFVARFRQGRIYPGSRMAWESYRTMTESDLRSLYRYLRTLAPVRHLVGPPYRKVGEAPKGP